MLSGASKTLPIIDPEFKTQIEPLTNDEFEQLEKNILEGGCRDPLVVWAGHNILIDGHNRLEICTRHGTPYQVKEIELETRQDVISWIIDNQLGRRNLTPEQQSYLRGKRYNSEKGSRGKNHQNDVSTSSRLANYYKVSKPTIERDAQFANAVDHITSLVGDEVRTEILGRDTKFSKQQAIKLAKLVDEDPELARDAFHLIQDGEGSASQVIDTQSITSNQKHLQKKLSADSMLDDQASVLGLPRSREQVLPDVERNHSNPANVDDRPFASPVLVSPPASPSVRVENDFYPTNALLTKTLLEEVDITGQIIEPCAGDGAIASELPSECITNDLYPHPEYTCGYNLDATDPAVWQQWGDLGIDWVVTNPPYNRAHEIIPLAFEHTRIGVAVLLRLSYLEPCANRTDWLKAHSDHFCKIITLNPRPRFRSDTQNTDSVTVAWMVWRKDFSWKRIGIECPFKFVNDWNTK